MLEPHKQLLPYLFTFVIDIAIFFALYQYRRYAIVVHAVIATLCVLTALITALPLLIKLQIPSEGSPQTHAIIGLVVLILILIQLTAGLISKALQCISHNASYGIFLLNRVHRINGYILALLGKVEVYLSLWNGGEQDKLYVLLAIDGTLLILLIARKITRKEIQS
jgi:peptidoglycan/LPS O-acetylase OafA/YrhL